MKRNKRNLFRHYLKKLIEAYPIIIPLLIGIMEYVIGIMFIIEYGYELQLLLYITESVPQFYMMIFVLLFDYHVHIYHLAIESLSYWIPIITHKCIAIVISTILYTSKISHELIQLLLNVANYYHVEFYYFYFIVLFRILPMIVIILILVAYGTLFERKAMSSMQRRRGPNVVGLFGTLQPLSDGLKLFSKETIYPTHSNKFIFIAAPIFTFFCSLMLWSVIPLDSNSNIFVGLLMILGITSLSVYGVLFSGWSSNSKYAFLGAIRSASQVISYELCSGLFCSIPAFITGSFNLVEIVTAQSGMFFIWPLFPIWCMLIICNLAETNRAPFDLPEAEAELVAGYNVEYSSLGFALFFLGEYANIFFISTLMSFLFLGGWLPCVDFIDLPPAVWLSLKVSFHVFVFIWVRASFPRYRVIN